MDELIGPKECHLSVDSGEPCTNIEYLTKLEEAVKAAKAYKECVESGSCTMEALEELRVAMREVYKDDT